MVPPSSIRISRVPTYSSSPPFYRFSNTGLSPSSAGFSTPFFSTIKLSMTGLFPFRSPLLRKSRLISFPLGTEMFQFPRFASSTYVFSAGYPFRDGFPHSDIFGSKSVADSPKLFAGCHVFLRLLLPRHPPCALNYLII